MQVQKFYNVYIFKYRKNISYSEIEKSFEELPTTVRIPKSKIKYVVKDISNLGEENQKTILNALVGAERIKVYEPNNSAWIYIHLFKLSEMEYLSVVSLYSIDEIDENLVFKTLYGMYFTEPISMFGNKKESKYSSIAHWRDIIPENPEGVFEPFNTGYSNVQVEVFYLDKDYISESLENTELPKKRSMKTMLTIIWGRILCNVFHVDSILMEDDHLGGVLPKIPIKYQIKRKPSEQYEYIKKQLIDAEFYDMCTLEELEASFNYDVSRYVLCSQQFILNGKYREFFNNIKQGVLYQLDPYVKSAAPLVVTYNPFGEKPYICYEYKEKVFGHLNMEDLHNTFCEILKAAIPPLNNEEQIQISFEKDISIKPAAASAVDEAEERRLAAKISSLRKFEMFENYSEEEIKELAQRSEVVHKNLQETVIETDSRVNSVFLILSGRIEMCGVDTDSYLHTLMLLKSGELFGIESLLSENKSYADYSVCSSDVVLLAIDADYFMEPDEKRFKLIREMLDIQSSRLTKFQKLFALT